MKRGSPDKDAGFVLIVALLAAGVLGAVMLTFSVSVRSRMQEASAVAARAEVEALADGGINLAIAGLINAGDPANGGLGVPLEGRSSVCRSRNGAILDIRMRDEAGRIDINAASEALLEALFTGVTGDATSGRSMAQSLLDYRDTDDTRRPFGAEAQEYREAGSAHGPKNAPFAAVAEIAGVLNIRRDVVDKVSQYLTTYSGQTGIDPHQAEPELLSLLLAGAGRAGVEGFGVEVLRERFAGALPSLVTPSQHRMFAVRATARTAGAAFAREAVVEIDRRRATPYAIKSWQQVGADPVRAVADGAPDC